LLLGTKKFKFETQVFIFTSKLQVLVVAGIETCKELVQFLLDPCESTVEGGDVVTKFLDHLILSCQLRPGDISSQFL
jgi:hypothetical protein